MMEGGTFIIFSVRFWLVGWWMVLDVSWSCQSWQLDIIYSQISGLVDCPYQVLSDILYECLTLTELQKSNHIFSWHFS